MSQHDFDIANADYPTVRADINLAFAAAVENNKGSSAPTTKFVGMLWIDDAATPWLAKRWDGTDWITEGAINATTNAYTPYVGTAALALATETVEGLVELSSSAENVTGTATDKWPDVAGVKEMIDTHASAGGVGKNLIINGDMKISQRGTSFAAFANADYTIDRYRNTQNSTAVATLTQDATGIFAAWGSDYSMKIDCTTVDSSIAAADHFWIEQRIEGQDVQHLEYGLAGAQDVTVSFLFQSPKSGTHCVALQNAQNTRTQVKEFTVASADTPEKIEVTFSGDTGGSVIPNNNAHGLVLVFPMVAGTDYHGTVDTWVAGSKAGTSSVQNLFDNTANNIYIGQVKLEVGSSATSFEYESYGETVRKCERYYQQHLDTGVTPATNTANEIEYYASGHTSNAHTIGIPVFFGTRMRAAPTIVLYDAVGTINQVTVSSGHVAGAVNYSNEKGFRAGGTSTAATTRHIQFYYTAASEL